MFRSAIKLLGYVVLFATSSSAAIAGDIPQSCMVSFNVRDKAFDSGHATMSCRLLELRREKLFSAIEALPASGSISGEVIAAQLQKIEKDLRKLEGETNWTGLSISLTGNTLATLGLASCLETAGGGCAIAIIGKVLSVAGIIDSAVDGSQKQAASAKVRAEIDSLRAKVKTLNRPADQVRQRLIAEAVSLCDVVKRECLAN